MRQGADPGTPGFTEALHAARQAVKLTPHFPVAQDLLGALYMKEENNDLAEQAFRAALADDPSDQSAMYHLLTRVKKSDHADEVPDLLKRLAQAKQEAHNRDVQTSKYRIFEAE